MRVLSDREWLKSVWLPILLSAPVVFAWAGLVNVTIYRSLGITMAGHGGQRYVFLEDWFFRSLHSAPFILYVAIFCVGLLLVFRRLIRLWLFLGVLILAAPGAIYTGRYLWDPSHERLSWEAVLPVTVAFALSFAIAVLLDSVIDRTISHLRALRGQCAYCGYDLRGGKHEACPECGMTT